MGIYSILAILMAYSAYRYSRRSENKRYTWVKILLTTFLLILVSFVTKKYYEVPVHVNSLKLENLADADSDVIAGSVHVDITYDYNNSPAMRESPLYKKSQVGLGYSFDVGFEPNHKKLFSDGYLNDSLKLDLRVRAENALRLEGVYDFNLDSVEHAFRGEVWSSNRQFLYPTTFSRSFPKDTIRRDTTWRIIREKDTIRCDTTWRTIREKDTIREITWRTTREKDTTSYIRRCLLLRGFKFSGRQHNGCFYESYCVLDNEETENHTIADYCQFLRHDYQYPNAIFTGEDISSAIEYFRVSFSDIPVKVFKSIKFEYLAPISVDGLPFEPDIQTMTSIIFNDSTKLAHIYQHGLAFHVTFPDMKNTQAVRTFIATGVLGWLVGLLFSLFAVLLRGPVSSLNGIRSWKEFFSTISSMLKGLVVHPFKSFCSLFHKEKNGHRYFYNYIRSHPLVTVLSVLFIIAIILLGMTMNHSDINPFGTMEGIDDPLIFRWKVRQ